MSAEEPGLVLRHIDLPLVPGARIVIRHSHGWTEFDPLGAVGSVDPRGYTIDVNGERWRASRPFKRSPTYEEALRLELAWNTALRIGRESEPPGPGPRYKEVLAEYVQRGPGKL